MPVDPRFFEPLGALTLGAIAELTGARINGDFTREFSGIAAAETAGPGDLCFHEGNAKTAAEISDQAGACFVKESAAEGLPAAVTAIIVPLPRWAHVQASLALFRLREWADDPGANSPSIHKSAKMSPGAVVCAGAAIGANTEIGPNAVVGPGVQIGEGVRIGANASLRCALIGNGVTILSGARIGESGFGVTGGPEGAEDIPQWGRVIIQDHALIGANTCIDRGAFADTIVGERTKIDNLCQIGHNVILGRNVLMASFTGISGSVTVGDGVQMGGRVGIADHVNIGEGAQLAASAGIFRDIPAGETWGGTPGKPIRQYLREVAWLQKQITPKKKT